LRSHIPTRNYEKLGQEEGSSCHQPLLFAMAFVGYC
jgi:hypothetical protein